MLSVYFSVVIWFLPLYLCIYLFYIIPFNMSLFLQYSSCPKPLILTLRNLIVSFCSYFYHLLPIVNLLLNFMKLVMCQYSGRVVTCVSRIAFTQSSLEVGKMGKLRKSQTNVWNFAMVLKDLKVWVVCLEKLPFGLEDRTPLLCLRL